jgi:hypothetical protein
LRVELRIDPKPVKRHWRRGTRRRRERSAPEQGAKARSQAATAGGLLGLLFAATAALRRRDVTEHLLDVHAAAGVGRPAAFGALDAPAHQATPGFSVRFTVFMAPP